MMNTFKTKYFITLYTVQHVYRSNLFIFKSMFLESLKRIPFLFKQWLEVLVTACANFVSHMSFKMNKSTVFIA